MSHTKENNQWHSTDREGETQTKAWSYEWLSRSGICWMACQFLPTWQHIPPKDQCKSTELHSVTSRKTKNPCSYCHENLKYKV